MQKVYRGFFLFVFINCQGEGPERGKGQPPPTILEPLVLTVSPSDSKKGINRNVSITVTFNQLMDVNSVTTNTEDNVCRGSIQISSDDFVNCLQIKEPPVTNDLGQSFTLTPKSNLISGTTYKIRVTGDVKNPQNKNITAYEMTDGFLVKQLLAGSVQDGELSLERRLTTVAGGLGESGANDGVGSTSVMTRPISAASDRVAVYVADESEHVVRKYIRSTGQWTVLVGRIGEPGTVDGTGENARLDRPTAITVGPNQSYLYFSDQGSHTIRRIDLNTTEIKTVAGIKGESGQIDGGGSRATFDEPSGLVASSTDLYILDKPRHLLRKMNLTTHVVTTLTLVTNPEDTSNLNHPTGITLINKVIYLTDSGNHTIRKITTTSSSYTLSTIAGSSGLSGTTDGIRAASRFDSPEGITGSETHLYVTDKSRRVRKISLTDYQVTTIAGDISQAGAINETMSRLKLNDPKAIMLDSQVSRNDLYILDTGSSVIWLADLSSSVVSLWAGIYKRLSADEGFRVTSARFNTPTGLTTDGSYLYIADSGNHTIRRLELSTGTVVTYAGALGEAGHIDGDLSAARFQSPVDLTLLGENLYVVDDSMHVIRKIDTATEKVTTLSGIAGLSGSVAGPGITAKWNAPSGITSDGISLYVTERGNHSVRILDPGSGVSEFFAGSSQGESGSTDGSALDARFNSPHGLTSDGGLLYITDRDNHTIRRLEIKTQTVSTFAGAPGASGTSDGTGGDIRFQLPVGITTDGKTLYITDEGAHTVRRIVVETATSDSIAGYKGRSGALDGLFGQGLLNRPRGIVTDGVKLFVADSSNHVIRGLQ